jgi:hypothetical protein
LPGEHLATAAGGLNVTGEPGTIAAAGDVLSLDQVAERVGYSVADQIALDVQKMRRGVAERVVRAFIVANGVALAALGALAVLDEFNIMFQLVTPGERIITPQVFMALLGATTVQVGTIAAIIARYLFPGRSRGD